MTDDVRTEAIKRLHQKRALRTQVLTWLAFSVFFTVIWLVAGEGYFWPVFPIVGWGIGIAMQAVNVFGHRPITEDDIRREMDQQGPGT